MPSRRRLLACTTAALSGALVAGCTIPLGSIPRVETQPCPPLDRVSERHVCSHIDTAGGIDLSVSPTTVAPPSEAIEQISIQIENNTETSLTLDPEQWALYRTTGFGWKKRNLQNREASDTSDVIEIEPSGTFGASGLDAFLFHIGPGESAPVGLYAAVITVGKGAELDGPDRKAGTPVDCVFLFRVSKR